ncbi:hypothetical protein DES53_104356 [Roseimicrobium gellanilyticum]|uniref:Uncharacterized protein n=1 Tax=Roseimicrobium gellanilyticum TaxID=748857 RepID=A0A366HPL9_9BACT|nr:hypothetical protein [Roseimicrobium gellanilyticum]RBP44535.1 hypothetical protein DES53_104356 [Roseimicrobium gellanilyticum]
MSTTHPGKSHIATWALLLLAVPLLYVLTVPAVMCIVVRPRWSGMASARPSKTTKGWVTDHWPDWLNVYCEPYNWLVDETPLGPHMLGYQQWWWKLCDK